MKDFLEYLYLYIMEFVQIKCEVREKSSSFWWCKRYSESWSDSRKHSEIVLNGGNLGHMIQTL